MHDILPADQARWQLLEQTARDHFTLYGYSELRTPIVEESALFCRSVGEMTDIVQKEMYTFEDKGGGSLTLRPEGTASIVRSAIQNNLINQTSPELKVYYMGPMYRHERPQKGRFRQFYQIGVENFGSASAEADAEVIEMLASYLKKVGVIDWKILLNSLGEGHERRHYGEQLKGYLNKNSSKFCENCKLRIERNPLRVLDCKNPSCQKLAEGHPNILDYLEEVSKNHFEAVKAGLDRLGIPYCIDPNMVRGIDYYQRTVFEFVSDKLGVKDTIAAGGRYDSLVKDLGGPNIPGTGFAIGLERLLMLLPQTDHDQFRMRIFLSALGLQARQKAFEMAAQLRGAGLACELDYEEKSLKAQMRRADRLKSTHVLILGDDELKRNVVQIKEFAGKSQSEVPLGDVLTYFQKQKRP